MEPPTVYCLRIAGRLDPHWSVWFDGLELAYDTDGTTTMTGPVADQAALHGLLRKIRDLGVPLLEITRVTAHE
jgi:hypothetical protein